GRAQEIGLASDYENSVQTRDWLKLDGVLAKPPFARIHDLFQLGYDRLWSGVANREYANRLPAHPIDIEAKHGFDRGATFGAAALNNQQIARRVGAHRARLGRKAVEKLDQSAGGNVTQRNHRHSIAGLGVRLCRIQVAGADRITERY